MDELTRVVTVEITSICKGNIENVRPKEQVAKELEEVLKMNLNADDVLVTNIQDFPREVEV